MQGAFLDMYFAGKTMENEIHIAEVFCYNKKNTETCVGKEH